MTDPIPPKSDQAAIERRATSSRMQGAAGSPSAPDLAMRDGYSTGRSLGLGLPGSKRVMDDFEIDSRLGQGTTVAMRRWLR
jgi:anti-sigma regulatory factor (Ser/Thr protein kinase)